MPRPLFVASVALVFLLTPMQARAKDEPLSPAQRKAAKAKHVAAERAFVEKVNAAIDKGAKWLASTQLSDGTFPIHQYDENNPQNLGRQALVLLTLAKCGMKEKDPCMKKGLEGLRMWFKKVESPGWGWKTYCTAVTLMLYEALLSPPSKSGQKPKQGKKKKRKKKRSGSAKVFMEHAEVLTKKLVTSQEASGWRYPGGTNGVDDLSNTQYAMLGLRAAVSMGIDVKPDVFESALEYALKHQRVGEKRVQTWIPNPSWEPWLAKDMYGQFMAGAKVFEVSWAYMPNNPKAKYAWTSTGSMTTAGIAVVAIIKEQLTAHKKLNMELRKKIDASLRGGLAWLGNNFSVTKNPGDRAWHYYYLYGMERVGALLGVSHMGQNDWYKEGATYLIEKQKENGSWWDPGGGPNDKHTDETLQTCFALLFLKRATAPPPVILAPVTTDGDG